MKLRALFRHLLLAGLFWSALGWSGLLSATPAPAVRAQVPATRRINAPYFEGEVRFSETAVLWFGQVTPTANSADARVGYNDTHVFIRVAAFDRRLWYDTSPSPDDLTAWDAVTLYLDTDGNSGSAPDANSYRFDAQLVWWETRDSYQVAYRGNGSDWGRAAVPFTTRSFWRGYAPNSGEDDRAWGLEYLIPYEGLGLSGPPVEGTVWGMALALHDRDDAQGTAIPDQIWPETMAPRQSATWGQLAFGLPTFDPPPAIPEGTLVVRQGLDGANVVDAGVGGSTLCGSPAAPDYFSTWGTLNYAGKSFINIQNLRDAGDWMCFSRYYVTFPLDALPPGKAVLSATLTLVQFGNAGEGYEPGPQPSLIQVHTVAEDWDEATVNWNNAPLAAENVSAAWAEVFPEQPGEPRHWDVSRAVAVAYAAGGPLRLALYEADGPYHSGKYFWSSDVGEWSAEMRPTLTITYGRPAATILKSASTTQAYQGDSVDYTLDLVGSGNVLDIVDTLPEGVSAPSRFELSGTSVTPEYDAGQHRLTWTDTPPWGQQVTLTYTVEVLTVQSRTLVNVAELRDAGGEPSFASETVIANPRAIYLPLVLTDN